VSKSSTFAEELFGLRGKCALVTGGRQGIGRAIAVALARMGADIVVTGRAASDVIDTVEQVRQHGVRALGISLDVTKSAEADEAIERALQQFQSLDIAVNNAAVTVRSPAADITDREWGSVIETNLTGTFLVSRAAARGMGAKGGRIINLSSTYARVPRAGRAAYAASKAGVEQLTRVLAKEWAPAITVNAIAPATILTDTRAEFFKNQVIRDARIAEIPMGRLGTTDDILGAVLLLSGAAGAFITGQTIVVDGGFSLA
jgi:NAD(P)-dependent dehydrogenase (short-subunit alcohol dehydrogenase family)